MIKFTAETKDGPGYFFGLSRENINRLTSGQPIRVKLAEMGGPNITIGILFGETERALFDDLKTADLIPEGIEYHEAESGMVEVVRFKREKGEQP